jgi:HK97 family phage portal protein
MRVFGLTLFEKKLPPTLSAVPGQGGWFGLIREPFTGAWQRNLETRVDSVLAYSAVFRCIGLIASDVAKMRMKLVELTPDGIWKETTSPAFSPVLRKPNRYQTRIQFFQTWMESKLVSGNAYILKGRDNRAVVTELYVLDPSLVTVLVAPDGAVYYQLQADFLAGVRERTVTIPASEIIHDRYDTANSHPLVGISPIQACGLAATQGLKIQENSAQFFANGSSPGGILTAPGKITNETALRIRETWDADYGVGKPRVGKLAVLGDGLKYETMSISAADAQLIEQLKWTAETVASVFGVPAYKIGVGTAPTYNNIEALDAGYYSQCLQIHIESIEECMDDGLGLGPRFGNPYGTEFDLDGLLRMDTATKVRAAAEGVKAGFMAPNEARFKFDLPPVDGGESPYLQIQNYSLEALAKRDSKQSPGTPGIGAQPAAATGGAQPKPADAAVGAPPPPKEIGNVKARSVAPRRSRAWYERQGRLVERRADVHG